MTIETSDWIDFFPHTSEGIRPLQEKAINFILNRLHEGVENIFFEGPTGTGKSFVAYLVALYFAIVNGWSTRFLVPNRFLEDQYVRDFASLGMKQLHSAAHYCCPTWGSCAVGRGSEIIRTPPKEPAHPDSFATPAATATAVKSSVKCQHQDSCPYLKARSEFQAAPIAVTNTAYALTCARFGHDFVKADLVIFDEAHNLGNQMCAMFELEIPLRVIDVIPPQGSEYTWLQSVYRPDIEAQLKVEIAQLEAPPRPADIPELEKEVARLAAKLANIDTLLRSDPRDWAIVRNAHSLLFQPIWTTNIAPALLGFLSERRLLMSATFLDQTIHLQTLGL